jgi:hypothetical protein
MALTFPYGSPHPRQLTIQEIEQRPRVQLIHPEIRRRVFAMMNTAAEQGVVLGIGGAGRTKEGQISLFRKRYTVAEADSPPCAPDNKKYQGKCWAKNPGVAGAAVPGNSYHEVTTPDNFALALDMQGDITWMLDHTDRFGLVDFRNVGNEPWHVQPIEVPTARVKYNPDKHGIEVFDIDGVEGPARLGSPAAPPGPPGIAPFPFETSTLRRGDTGPRVYLAQTILHLGASQMLVIPNGVFDELTETGMRNLQIFFGMHVTGEIDTEDWRVLHELACQDLKDDPA